MKADRFIALDIGTDRIGLAVVENRDGQIELLDSGFAPIDSGASPNIPHEALAAMTLKKLLDEKRPIVKQAVISIEGQAVFSRLVKLPAVPAEKIAATIRHEAVQNIPFPLNEVVWDAHIFDPDSPEPEVLIAAVKAELVDGMVGAVGANGLNVTAVDIAPAALANAVRFNGADEPVLLVDVGTHSTNLVFVDGDRTFFRSLPVSAEMVPRLKQEIARSISFYLNQHGGNSPVKILQTGEPADLSGLDLPVETFDPFRKMKGEGAGGGVLAGLAVRENAAIKINLIPETLQKARRFKKRQPVIISAAISALLVFAVWIFGLNQMAGLTRQKTAAIKGEIARLEPVENRLIPLEEKAAELEREANVYRELAEQRAFWLDTLAEIKAYLPKGMFLLKSEPIKTEDKVSGLRISAVSYLDYETEGADAVAEVRNALQSSPRFSDKTKVTNRPTKRLFAREFVLDVFFEEAAP